MTLNKFQLTGFDWIHIYVYICLSITWIYNVAYLHLVAFDDVIFKNHSVDEETWRTSMIKIQSIANEFPKGLSKEKPILKISNFKTQTTGILPTKTREWR